MERALKERIIGAIVLVAVVVLVVPVFLDGPPASGEIRSERVPLPGQDEQKTQTVVLDRNRTEPVPAQAPPPAAESSATSGAAHAPVSSAPGDAAERDSTPPVTVAKVENPANGAASQDTEVAVAVQPTPSPSTAKAPVSVRPANSSTGMFAVQLGSFSNKANAEKLAADLRKQGFAAFLSQLATDTGQLQRVRVGPQKDREAAEAMAAKLAKAGHKGQVVPHP